MYQWETRPLDVRRYSYFLKNNICWFNHWCIFTVNIFFGGGDGVTVREAVECKWGSELPIHVLHLTIVELTLQWLYSLDPQYSYITYLKLSKLSLPRFSFLVSPLKFWITLRIWATILLQCVCKLKSFKVIKQSFAQFSPTLRLPVIRSLETRSEYLNNHLFVIKSLISWHGEITLKGKKAKRVALCADPRN